VYLRAVQYRLSCIYPNRAEEEHHMTQMPSTFPTRTVPPPKPLILCIEDDPSYLSLRKAVLERSGYNVIGVVRADDALKALRDSPVTAIIADHLLEGTTGTELAREMKQIKPDIPIILFSGNVPQDLSCVDVYVRKGEPTEKLLSIVRDVVQRSYS
jgi:CheY-like chemotaxis protein